MWTLSEFQARHQIHMNKRKLCDKSYPCGRSPGGHMRSRHVAEALPEAEEAAHSTVKLASLFDYSDEEEEEEAAEVEVEEDEQVYEDEKDSMAEEANENAETELRQLCKKKKKKGAEDLNTKKFVCVKCGKGFQSQKAMCGHMACHSEKDNKGLNNLPAHRSKSSWLDQKALTDGHSDNETGVAGPGPCPGPTLRRRSKRAKSKNNEFAPAGSKPDFSVPDYTGGSLVYVVENEQEEVAKCLMMLSRDSGRRGGFNSVGDSSELSVEDMSRFKASGGQIGLRLTRGHTAATTELVRNKSANDSCTNVEVSRTCFKCLVCGKMFGTHPALVKHAGKHFRLNGGSKRSAESDENSVETDMFRKGKMGKKCGSKRVKHECPVCLKGFRSGQALGGHKRIHLTGGGGSDELKPVDEQVPVQDSSSQAQSCIELNQPAPVEGQEFVPW